MKTLEKKLRSGDVIKVSINCVNMGKEFRGHCLICDDEGYSLVKLWIDEVEVITESDIAIFPDTRPIMEKDDDLVFQRGKTSNGNLLVWVKGAEKCRDNCDMCIDRFKCFTSKVPDNDNYSED